MLIVMQRMMQPFSRGVKYRLNASIFTSARNKSFVTLNYHKPFGLLCHQYCNNKVSQKRLNIEGIKLQTNPRMRCFPSIQQNITFPHLYRYHLYHTKSTPIKINDESAKEKRHTSPMMSGKQLHHFIEKFLIRMKKKPDYPHTVYTVMSKQYRKKNGDDISLQQFYNFYKDKNLQSIYVEYKLPNNNMRIDCICEEADGTYTLYDWKRSKSNLNELCKKNSTKMNKYISILKTRGIKVHRALIVNFHPKNIGYQVGQIPIQPKKDPSIKKVNK